jgi:hypothetical protein
MSNPIIEQIALKIKEAIDAVTIANGFNQDLTAVRPKRLHLESDLNADNTVFIRQEAAEASDSQLTTETITWIQGFVLTALAIDSDSASDSIDTRLNKIAADIQKQLLSAGYNTLGGLADGVLFRATEAAAYLFGQNYAGIDITIDVLYTTDYADPYSQS